MLDVNELVEIHHYLRNRCDSTLADLLQLPQPDQLRVFNPSNALFLATAPASPHEEADFLTALFTGGSEVWFTTQAGHLISQDRLSVELLVTLCSRLAADQSGVASPGQRLFYGGEVFVVSPDQPGTHICTDKGQLGQLYNQLTSDFTQPMTVRFIDRAGNPLRFGGAQRMPDFLTLRVELPVSDTEMIP